MFTTPDGKDRRFVFILVASLFLLWGFCNGMIDVMDKHFQDELGLSKSQSAWVQFAHYLGYFLMAMPAGWLATRLGYKGGIIGGLLVVSLGGFWFLPAAHIQEAAHAGHLSAVTAFVGYLFGVCLIATGLTFLETVANPYTTVLGEARYAAARINLAQSANGIGWIFGPIVGAQYFYSADPKIYVPYVGVAIVVIVLAAIFFVTDVPDVKNEDDYHIEETHAGVKSLWEHPHFVMAVAAQFFYVAAQAGIFSFFINSMTPDTQTGFTIVPAIPDSLNTAFMHASVSTKNFFAGWPGWISWSVNWIPDWLSGWFKIGKDGAYHISNQGASNLASVGFICFLLGRITGAGLLKKFAAHKVLGLYAAVNVIACILIFLNLGWLSVACVFLSYFFMSIMFPTIFALGIFGLGDLTKKASSFIVMAIMGGAILPKLMGFIADKFDMAHGYIVPAFCFAFVAFYSFNWSKLAKSDGLIGVSAGKGH